MILPPFGIAIRRFDFVMNRSVLPDIIPGIDYDLSLIISLRKISPLNNEIENILFANDAHNLFSRVERFLPKIGRTIQKKICPSPKRLASIGQQIPFLLCTIDDVIRISKLGRSSREIEICLIKIGLLKFEIEVIPFSSLRSNLDIALERPLCKKLFGHNLGSHLISSSFTTAYIPKRYGLSRFM